jgi:SAM-dependent methyltransferase
MKDFRGLLSWFRAVVRHTTSAISHSLKAPNKGTGDRFAYQKEAIGFQFRSDSRVLDVGSGSDPFPFATVLADRFLTPTVHRSSEFEADSKPVVVCDLHNLPFATDAFDYVVCAHVLEHVEDPIRACEELQRVGTAGLVEVPSAMKDALFSWAESRHIWYINAIAGRLVFFEYNERQLRGINCGVWRDLIFAGCYHPLQSVFWDNQDLFNVIFEWSGSLDAMVLRTDGSVGMTTNPTNSDE